MPLKLNRDNDNTIKKTFRRHLLTKTIALYCVFLLINTDGLAQTSAYQRYVEIADSLYLKGQYKLSAQHFSKAFESFGWKGALEDRFRAARSWSLSSKPDSAFYNLFSISERLLYSDIAALKNESAFKNLHSDPRWHKLNAIVEENGVKKIEFKTIKDSLEQIFRVDQDERAQLEEIYKKTGMESSEFKSKIQQVKHVDSLHTLYVSKILDKYGWLGNLEVGRTASTALLVVILHSNKETQIKYLPIIQSAFENKKIDPHNYSLLIDKISLAKNGKQIYGTQFGVDKKGKHFVYPLKDKQNVNKRRKEIELGPLEEYLKYNGIESY